MRAENENANRTYPLITAVLLPCYNEGPVIAQVVKSFRSALPQADIYIYDNNSTDDTAVNALTAGAIVRHESMQGKGHVVRRMFADVEADIYVLADGDGTYEPSIAPRMIELLEKENLDMVVGIRAQGNNPRSYRFGHLFGNRFLTATVGKLFNSRFRDILSGYRVMSRRLVKSFPALASGFEIEAMLTIHTLDLRLPYAEVECPYFERQESTESKLNTLRDGFRILGTIMLLYKEYHPFRFFVFLSGLLVIISLALGIPVVIEFLETGLVPRVPTAILATGLMILAGIGLTIGLILDSVSRERREIKRLHYQALPSTQELLSNSSYRTSLESMPGHNKL
jgi:glycosyltransferase involved in cell wall biosynthesis